MAMEIRLEILSRAEVHPQGSQFFAEKDMGIESAVHVNNTLHMN